MQRRRTLTGLAAALIVLGACQSPPAPLTAADQSTLRAMFDSVVSEVNSSRWDAWAAHYAENGVLQRPNGPKVTGRPAILAWGKAFPPIESLSFSNVEVMGEGNLAYGTSSYALKLKDMPQDTGKQLVVFRRTAGAWEVMAASFNSDLPLAAPAPASPPPKP